MKQIKPPIKSIQLLLFALLTALPLNSYATQTVEYSFIVPAKLAGLDGITDLTVTGLTNDQQISGTYQFGGQINYFFYDFKDKSQIILQGARGLTAKGNVLPFDIGHNVLSYTTLNWNRNGQAAGNYSDENEHRMKGFIYANGEYSILAEPDGSYGLFGIFGFNDHNQVLINYYAGNEVAPFLNYFVYTNGMVSVEPLSPDISRFSYNFNNNGQVVGGSSIAGANIDGTAKEFYFLHSDNGFTYADASNALNSRIDINDKGQIYIFYSERNTGMLRMVKYDQGVYTRLDPPSEVSGTSLSVFVNNNGQIVGKYADGVDGRDSGANSDTFLYDKGVYTLLNLPNALRAGNLLAFNDNGQIIGYYLENNVWGNFVANPLDTFDPSTQTLHLNNVLVNGNMVHDITTTIKFSVVSIASSVAKGSIATEITNPVDTFDPATHILTLNAVVVGDTQYNQVVLKLIDYQLLQ